MASYSQASCTVASQGARGQRTRSQAQAQAQSQAQSQLSRQPSKQSQGRQVDYAKFLQLENKVNALQTTVQAILGHLSRNGTGISPQLAAQIANEASLALPGQVHPQFAAQKQQNSPIPPAPQPAPGAGAGAGSDNNENGSGEADSDDEDEEDEDEGDQGPAPSDNVTSRFFGPAPVPGGPDMAYPAEGMKFQLGVSTSQKGRRTLGGGVDGASAVVNAWTRPHGYRMVTRRSKVKRGRNYLTMQCARSGASQAGAKTKNPDGKTRTYTPRAATQQKCDCPFKFILREVEKETLLFEVRMLRSGGLSLPHNHGPDPSLAE